MVELGKLREHGLEGPKYVDGVGGGVKWEKRDEINGKQRNRRTRLVSDPHHILLHIIHTQLNVGCCHWGARCTIVAGHGHLIKNNGLSAGGSRPAAVQIPNAPDQQQHGTSRADASHDPHPTGSALLLTSGCNLTFGHTHGDVLASANTWAGTAALTHAAALAPGLAGTA